MRSIVLSLVFCLIQVVTNAEEFTARVINVIDGNTFEIMGSDNQSQRLVLFGIDCPEPGQEYADKAKKLLEKLILDKEVKVNISGKDRWGSYLAVIKTIKNDVDPRLELLEEGYAWTAERNPLPELESIRLKAMGKGKGLWKDPDPKAPWLYRREQSMMQAKSS